jgi:hypothetical protein
MHLPLAPEEQRADPSRVPPPPPRFVDLVRTSATRTDTLVLQDGSKSIIALLLSLSPIYFFIQSRSESPSAAFPVSAELTSLSSQTRARRPPPRTDSSSALAPPKHNSQHRPRLPLARLIQVDQTGFCGDSRSSTSSVLLNLGYRYIYRTLLLYLQNPPSPQNPQSRLRRATYQPPLPSVPPRHDRLQLSLLH